MVEFCPDCSNLLREKRIDEIILLACKCGYEKELLPDNKIIEKRIQKKKDALEENLIIISENDKISVYPQVKKICPKCKNKLAETWQTQMRSADEPSTHFFRCTQCKHTWREVNNIFMSE
ncbi:MAG: transcription factor S [Promethearchaeota archaeon]|jgi:DNA-directed RNA polymerase subunit M